MFVSPTLREALTAKIPDADFEPYFVFIESLPWTDIGHRHHVLPKKGFPEFAKDPDNIVRLSPADHFRAHYWLAACAPNCVAFQVVFCLMANKKRVYQIDPSNLTGYAEVYALGRMRQAAIVRGQGLKNVESGHLSRIGVIGGRLADSSGRLAKLRTTTHQVKAGQAAGKKSVESGHWKSLKTHEHQVKAGSLGGSKSAERGHLSRASHAYWHVRRGIVSPRCKLCVA